ncbi:MAG: ABC-2 family transporter protein [Prochloron sp. SP5CPC1]|nr:ABC-2 family transporter protein [Candidatus Paraprochloron terpiosi SP5CPC1]
MKWLFKQATALLSVYYAHMVEYRAELFLWALSGSLPIILMGVWTTAAEEGNFGLEPMDFARYFISVFIVREFTVVWVIWEFEKEVVEGKLSFALLQPIDPVWRHVAMHLSERFARLPIILFLVGFFFLLYPEAIWFPSIPNIFLCIIATAMAFTLRFLLQYTLAMFAFWTERAAALEQISFLFYLFLSGLIAPLEVFPPLIREIALWTPFPYFIHFPAALIIGLPVNFQQAMSAMLAWGVLFFFLNRWLWRRGIKKYSGMGA